MNQTHIPSSNLPDWQLKFSYFYVSNKILLRKIFILFLVLINCFLWGYSIYGSVIWALDFKRLKQQTEGLLFSSADILPLVEAVSPKDLEFSAITSLSSFDSKTDLFVEVTNSNPDWLANFDYAFINNNSSSTFYSAFVLPNNKKILLDLGRIVGDTRLEIKNLQWKKIPKYSELKELRERFTVNKYDFFPAAKVGDPSRLSFSITNESAFSYRAGGAVIFLYNGGNLVSASYLSIPEFKSGSVRTLETNWTKVLPRIDSVEIVPEINYLDSDNIMPPDSF